VIIKHDDKEFIEEFVKKWSDDDSASAGVVWTNRSTWDEPIPSPGTTITTTSANSNLTIDSSKLASHGMKITDSVHDTSGSIVFRDNLLSICNKRGEEIIVFDIETGKIKFPSTLRFEEAARIFWGAVALVMHQHMIPATQVKEERERREKDYLELLDELKGLREELQKKNQLINKLLTELKRMEEMNNGETDTV
jgi:hypothetical protein